MLATAGGRRVHMGHRLEPNFHARSIVTDTGWKITLDRGLDLFRSDSAPGRPTLS
jgi:hypothetical protein